MNPNHIGTNFDDFLKEKGIMTDKQIIIDGIDVSRCNKFEWSCYRDICEEVHNCYYKQLKRSEAQCEAMFVTHTDLEKALKAKEQECEELKTENKKLKEELLDLQLQFEEEQLMYEI